MKISFGIILTIVVLIQGCRNGGHLENVDQALSTSDTIVIRTQKVKGSGLFPLGAGSMTFEDTLEAFQYPVSYPKDIMGIKGIQKPTDFKSEKTDFIDIISGIKDSEKVFVVDQNNNQDFTDDSVRVFKKMDWYSSKSSIKCTYFISNGQEMVQDSSWVKIGVRDDRILYGRDEHLTADFNLNGNQYKVGIIDVMLTNAFTYGLTPEIVLLAKNSQLKDTLVRQDFIKHNEYLNLDGSFYRFDDITNDGRYITLVKEVDFANKSGTQIGMLAPDFDCLSVEGDTIRSSDLRDKPIVLANSCACGGDKQSTEAFYNIKNTFGNKIYALRLDSGIKSGLEGWNVDVEHTYNEDLYNKYRQAYCSRTAFVIGENGRILNRFDVVNWESTLPKHIYD